MGWLTVATLWWLFFWTALGLCIGSFLNVVIYRLPRNRSLRSPLWSACPHCETRIRWYDNLPIISFLRLRGRCRTCKLPISPRYLVVEALMAVIVLMLIDAFLVAKIRGGLSSGRFGLTDQMTFDWPILAAHVILFACLFSMSAIDIEHYWVDIRFTNLATIAGFALHAIWTPAHSLTWHRPSDITAVVCVFAMIGLGITWILLACRPHVDPEDYDIEDADFAANGATNDSAPIELVTTTERPTAIAGLVAVIVLAGLSVTIACAEIGGIERGHTLRGLTPLILMFVLIVQESTVARGSDEQIMINIQAERHQARGVAMTEFGLLLPAMILGITGYWLATAVDMPWHEHFAGLLHHKYRIYSIPMMVGWSPWLGIATAASGYVIAGALGWAVRIFFTLLFGKEAFGAGDIHMMAAAGCIAGWPVVVIGFFLTCGIAMIGWVIMLPFKRARAIPLGPWLALSFLAVVVFYEPIIEWTPIQRTVQALGVLAEWYSTRS